MKWKHSADRKLQSLTVQGKKLTKKTMQPIRISKHARRMKKWKYYQYRRLSWLHFEDEARVQERQQGKAQQSYAWRDIWGRTTVFHERQYGRFIEIKNNFRRKELKGTNQGSSFHGDSLVNRDNVRAPIEFGRKR